MKKNIIYLLLILMPFIDLITSLNERLNVLPLSPGIIFKGLILVLIIIYILFLTKSKYQKKSLIYLSILFIFIIGYILTHTYIFKSNYLFSELNNLIKYIYFPILLVGLINALEDNLITYHKLLKTLIIVFTIYLIMLFIPNILKIGYKTYNLSYLKGRTGCFYSGNEISGILTICIPLLYFILTKKNYLFYYLLLIISGYSLNSIGTKTATLGYLFAMILILSLYLIKTFKTNKKSIIHFILSIIIVLIFTIGSASFKNYNLNISKLNNQDENPKETNNKPSKESNKYNKIDININNTYILAIFSSRIDYLENTLNIYLERPVIEKVIGIGFSNTKEIDNDQITKFIEIDLFDYFFHYGIIGLIIMLTPFTSYIIIYIKKKDKKLDDVAIIISILLGLGTSLIAGHVLNAPSVATIFSMFSIILILDKKNNETWQELLSKVYQKDKTTFYKQLDNNLINNHKMFIVTANPETFILSKTNEKMHTILNDKNTTITPDGVAIIKACKLFNIDINSRITGIDISTYLLEKLNKEKRSLYLFGSQKEVLKTLVTKIKKEYPHIKILGSTDGYVKDKDKIFKQIAKLKPDVTLVAMGIPIQEELIYNNLNLFTKGIFIGVGGTFDVLSGTKKRAPKIFIKLNLEWLYRILKEPKRIKRFIKYNLNFIFDIFLES